MPSCPGAIERESRTEESYPVLYDDNACGCNVVARESLTELCLDVALEEGSLAGRVLGPPSMGDRARGWAVAEAKLVHPTVCAMPARGEEKRQRPENDGKAVTGASPLRSTKVRKT